MKREIDRVPIARYRLSPNEEARLLKEEREKKKKLRLLMVRQQSKQISQNILKDVKAEKQKQLLILAEEIKGDFEVDKETRLQELEELYEKNIKQVGQAHVAAVEEDVEGKLEDRALVKQEDARVVLERGQKALEKLKQDLLHREMEESRQIRARQDALEKEKERAAYIASKPPPEKNPIDDLNIPKMKPVKFTDHDAFGASHYSVPPEYGVVKEQPQIQERAQVTAELEGDRYDELEAEKKRVDIERREKARVRHKVALEKERLNLDYDNILHELSDLQKFDRIRRQKVVANLPKQIFIPPSNRIEELGDAQTGMERAFEDMFIAGQTTEMKDLILDSVPVPAATMTTSDVSSVSTLDESVPRAAPTRHGRGTAKDISSSIGDSTVRQILDASKAPDSGLKNLLGKIKTQRDSWVRTSNGLPLVVPGNGPSTAEQSLTQYTDEDGGSSRTRSQEVTERSDVETLSTGEVDSKSTVSTKSQTLTEATSPDEGSITSTGTITESRPMTHSDLAESGTLNHPLEKAALVRQTPQSAQHRGMSEYLTRERLQQDTIARENRVIKQEAAERRQQLETQKQELENRLRDLEMKRLELQSRSQEVTGQFTPSATRHPPHSQIVPQPHLGVGIPVTRTAPLLVTESGMFNQSDLTHSSLLTGGSSSSMDLGRVREYQEKLLRRHGNQQEQMKQAREDLQKRVDEMLETAKNDYNSAPSMAPLGGLTMVHLPTFPRVSPLPETSPLGYFKDISPRVSGANEEKSVVEGSLHGTRGTGSLSGDGMLPLRPSVGSLAEDRGHSGMLSNYNDPSCHVPRSAQIEEQTTRWNVPEDPPMPAYRASTHSSQPLRTLVGGNEFRQEELPGLPESSTAMTYAPQSIYQGYGGINSMGIPSIGNSTDIPGMANPMGVPGMASSNAGLTQLAVPPLLSSAYTLPSSTGASLSARTDPTVDPMSARTDPSIDPTIAYSGVNAYLPSGRTGVNNEQFGGETDPNMGPLSARSDPLSARSDAVSARSDLSEYREFGQSGNAGEWLDGLSDYKNPVEITSTTIQPSATQPPVSSIVAGQPSQPPQPPPYYGFERRDLSTILEVDSPEKTALSRMSTIGERTNGEQSTGIGIPESSSMWKERTTDDQITQFLSPEESSKNETTRPPLISQDSAGFAPLDMEDDTRIRALYSGIDLTAGQDTVTTVDADTLSYRSDTSDTSTTSSKAKPAVSRNWHDILAENSLSSTVSGGQQQYHEQTRGIPVGESEPVSSGLSQYRQGIIIGAEENSTGINQFAPFSSSGFAPLLNNDTDNTFASTIPDDLPRDRNAFLELQEGSPSVSEFGRTVPLTRPLSSTPARKDVQAATNVTDLRKSAFMTSKLPNNMPEPSTNDTTVPGNSRYSDGLPSSIFSHQTPSLTQMTIKTPSTGKTGEISQYPLGSESSSGSDTNNMLPKDSTTKFSSPPSDDDLTQYKSTTASFFRNSKHTGSEITTSGAGFTLPPVPGFSMSQSESSQGFRPLSEMSLTQYSVDGTTRSQFEPLSAEFTSLKTGSYLGSATGSQSGSASGSVFSEEDRIKQDPKTSVVRFASGDPDVRMMSASSSDIGYSQPMTSQGHVPYTTQDFTMPSTGPLSSEFRDLSRPTTIGENREESGAQMSRPLDSLTQRIEETMRKHEKLLEESKRMSDRHEVEKQMFTGQTTLEFTALEGSTEGEMGITDEPDLTLLSGTSGNTSQHFQPHQGNDANSSTGKITDVSLLSFEQHEKSLVLTPSDHTGDLKTGDASLLSFEKHEGSFGSSLEGLNGFDNIFGVRKITPTPLEGSSPPLFLPLSSDPPTQQSTSMNNFSLSYTTTTTSIPSSSVVTASPSTAHVTMETLSSAGSDGTLTPTPQNTGLFEWEKDEFMPLRMEEATQEDAEQSPSDNQALYGASGVISIPVGKVDDSSEQDSMQGLSLQEVFARKKGHLINKSQQRKEAAKAKAEVGQGGVSTGPSSHMTKTMANWKKSRGLGKGAASRASKIPSPTKMTTKSSDDRKKDQTEMKQRTNRLYNQLEDVKQKKQEDTRKQQYAANRERAKEYTKVLHESRLKKKVEKK